VTVQVVLAMPEVQYQCELQVPAGTTARQAVLLALDAGLIAPTASIDINPSGAPLGIFSERVEDDHPCAHGDRVEIYRPLQQDPKELRRQRARQSSS
jgi:putative ubiquitin-RnfH superfamily antitoxin RatB of RatAB toxin-antitoxin module